MQQVITVPFPADDSILKSAFLYFSTLACIFFRPLRLLLLSRATSKPFPSSFMSMQSILFCQVISRTAFLHAEYFTMLFTASLQINHTSWRNSASNFVSGDTSGKLMV